MFGVSSNAAGQAWYDSLFKQFADWGVDFVKVDDICPNYRTGESAMIRRAIDKCGRAIVYSISAGPPAPRDAEHVRNSRQHVAHLQRLLGQVEQPQSPV